VVNVSRSDIGGLREGVLEIKGEDAYDRLQWESGAHRVQRIPVNDVKLQTSTATVAVLADKKTEGINVEASIPPQDLRIDYYRSSGPGGQHVNTTDSAVRITHLPTNTVVAIQDGRSQHQNKAKAMMIIAARINDAARVQEEKERSATVRALVGTGDRSERIRTYNFPQDRITDHRLSGAGGTINGVTRFMNADMSGEALDELLDKLVELQMQQRLENLLEPHEETEATKKGKLKK
jgi:peptide chain release factor 1